MINKQTAACKGTACHKKKDCARWTGNAAKGRVYSRVCLCGTHTDFIPLERAAKAAGTLIDEGTTPITQPSSSVAQS